MGYPGGEYQREGNADERTGKDFPDNPKFQREHDKRDRAGFDYGGNLRSGQK